MLAHLLFAGLLLQTSAPPPATASRDGQAAMATVPAKEDNIPALLKVKRIYVDSFGDDPVSVAAQSTITTALVQTKRFKVTENRERADAVLKGVALEASSQELHAYHEGTAVGQGAISDSSTHTETVKEAKLSIRLVDAEGDVFWTSTQESKGAKYKGASADVADRCVKQLIHDVEKLEAANSRTAATTAVSDPKKK